MNKGNIGEVYDVNNSGSKSLLKLWMKTNGQILQDKTYQILISEGIETIEDFKNFSVDEFNDMCNQMNNNKIPYGDRLKLKKVLQSFSSKDKFVHPEEVEAINNVKNEMNKLKNLLENLNLTQTQIKQKKEKITIDINNTFKELINQLKNRQKQLLLELNDIMTSKNKIINAHIDIVNNNIQKYGQQIQNCQTMIRQNIELNELEARKLQIIQVRDDLINGSKQIMNSLRENKVNTNISFMIEKNNIISYLNGLGTVSVTAVPRLVELKYEGQGCVEIVWKLLYKKQQTTYNKVRIEWSEVKQNNEQNNEKKDNLWKYKEISIEERKENLNNVSIRVGISGLYLFRVRVYDRQNNYTPYSNTKSIQFRVVSDRWFQQVIGNRIQIQNKTIAKFENIKWGWHTAYGNKVVKPNECHEWKLRLNVDVVCLYIGIIPDEDKLLVDKKSELISSHFVYRAHKGYLRNPENKSYPNAKFIKKGNILKVKLDLKNNEVIMCVNGVNYGAVPDYIPQKQNYRLALSHTGALCELEFV